MKAIGNLDQAYYAYTSISFLVNDILSSLLSSWQIKKLNYILGLMKKF